MSDERHGADPLTPREVEVLDLLRAGLANKQIARALGVGEQTVKFHLKNVYGKLGATGRTHAIVLAGQRSAESAANGDPLDLRRRMEPALSPLALARRTRKLHGHREAVVDGERRFTYEQFFDRCDHVSAALERLGVRPGDRVATVAFNTHAHLELFHALPQIGAVIVPLNHRLSGPELARLLDHCGARVVCAGAEFLSTIDALRGTLPDAEHFVSLDGSRDGWIEYELLVASGNGRFTPHAPDDFDLLSINYTSGTAQSPRGVMVGHRSAWTNAIGCLLHWPMSPEDRYLWLLPFFHGNGWGFVWNVTAAGALHVCLRSAAVEIATAAIERERVTALCAGRSALLAIAHVPGELRSRLPRGLRVLTAGSSPSASIVERVETDLGWDVTHAYGLTETAIFISFGLPPDASLRDDPPRRAEWKARQGVEPLTACELRIVDEEGEDVPRDGQTLGEVVMRGATLMLGYYRDPEATRRAFAGGWFHTGDAAVMHADGSIHIRDRFKDIIICEDQLVSSLEVEHALLHHPAVREAAVVGRPDEALGEAIHAFVVLQPGAVATPDAILATARARLAAFKWPRALEIVPDLPRTGSGKIIKQQLRRAEEGRIPEARPYPPE